MSRKQHTLLVCDEKEGERRKSKDAGEMAGIGESEIKIFIAVYFEKREGMAQFLLTFFVDSYAWCNSS